VRLKVSPDAVRSLAAPAIRLLAASWRVRTVHEERWLPLYHARRPHVFLLWHEVLLPLLWQHRRQGIAIVVSEAREGQYLADFARSIGDRRTRLDRWEPELNTAFPRDRRDTTTAEAIATSYRRLLLGSALAPPDRCLLRGWMLDNQTGAERFRAGLPQGWRLADKTGAGGYGTLNDVGVAWSPTGTPILIAALSRKHQAGSTADNALMAELAALAVGVVR